MLLAMVINFQSLFTVQTLFRFDRKIDIDERQVQIRAFFDHQTFSVSLVNNGFVRFQQRISCCLPALAGEKLSFFRESIFSLSFSVSSMGSRIFNNVSAVACPGSLGLFSVSNFENEKLKKLKNQVDPRFSALEVIKTSD